MMFSFSKLKVHYNQPFPSPHRCPSQVPASQEPCVATPGAAEQPWLGSIQRAKQTPCNDRRRVCMHEEPQKYKNSIQNFGSMCVIVEGNMMSDQHHYWWSLTCGRVVGSKTAAASLAADKSLPGQMRPGWPRGTGAEEPHPPSGPPP